MRQRAKPEAGRVVLEVADLTKRFGGFTAVREVGFDLRAGEILGLIGPNGSGKSTIFNLIAGALKPNAGSIRFEGREIGGQPPHRITNLGIGLRAWNMSRNYELWKAITFKKGTIRIGKETLDAEFLMETLERMGIKTDFHQRLGITNVDIMAATDPRLHPLHENFVFRGVTTTKDVINNIAGQSDNTYRLAVLLDGYERGLPMSEAMRHAQKFLFDYAYGLSPFEREVMRRMFPFYTFARFNIPLMLETLVKRPGLISMLGKTHNLLRDEERNPVETLIPSYVRNQWRFGTEIRGSELRVIAGGGLVAVEDLRLLGDLTRWRDDGLKDGVLRDLIGRMNPIAKLPYELFVGKNFYFGDNIREDETLHQAVFRWGPVNDWLNMRRVQMPDGSLLWRVDGYRWHILQQTHLARVYRTLSQTFGESDAETWQRFLPFFTGLRLVSIDLDRRFDHLEAVSGFSRTRIERALAQGDYVGARRILGTVDRDEAGQARVDESFEALRTLATLGPDRRR